MVCKRFVLLLKRPRVFDDDLALGGGKGVQWTRGEGKEREKEKKEGERDRGGDKKNRKKRDFIYLFEFFGLKTLNNGSIKFNENDIKSHTDGQFTFGTLLWNLPCYIDKMKERNLRVFFPAGALLSNAHHIHLFFLSRWLSPVENFFLFIDYSQFFLLSSPCSLTSRCFSSLFLFIHSFQDLFNAPPPSSSNT